MTLLAVPGGLGGFMGLLAVAGGGRGGGVEGGEGGGCRDLKVGCWAEEVIFKLRGRHLPPPSLFLLMGVGPLLFVVARYLLLSHSGAWLGYLGDRQVPHTPPDF